MTGEERDFAGPVDAISVASTSDNFKENSDASAEAGVKIDPKIDRLIGRSLEAHYEDLAAAPLPDAILVLLAELEAKERSK
jgi:hypothetical protein